MGNKRLIYVLKLLTLFILIIVFGCDNSVETLSVNSPKSIFGDLKIGDVSYYIGFEGDDYYDSTNINYHYTGDTLIVKLIDVNENGYLISSEYSEGSTYNKQIKSGELDSSYLRYTKSDSILI